MKDTMSSALKLRHQTAPKMQSLAAYNNNINTCIYVKLCKNINYLCQEWIAAQTGIDVHLLNSSGTDSYF